MQNYRHNLTWLCLALCVCVAMHGTTTAQVPSPYGFNASAPAPMQNYQPPALPNDQPTARLAANTPLSQPTDPASLGGPVEVSESPIEVNNIVGIIRAGGILMFPIMLCSVVVMVFIIERLLFLRRGRVIPRPFVRGVIEQLEQQQLDRDEALALCEENGSPIADLFVTALKKYGRPAIEIEQSIVDSNEHITSQLRRYLRLFNAISNLTPLLGLLGTVLGMIDAFNTIAQADAMGRPELLAGGIGSALLTTAAGLCVAIPAYAAFAYFLARTDKLILEMDALAQNVVDLISAEALQSGTTRSRSRSRKAA